MAKTRKAALAQTVSGSRPEIAREAELRRYIEAARAMRDEIRGNPKKARERLMEMGILDKAGKLSKQYR
jgi:hypothetical protein